MGAQNFSLPFEDLSFVRLQLQKKIEKLRNANILLTGGTGFFGKNLLDVLLFLNQEEKLGLNLYVITRNAAQFLLLYPHYSYHVEQGSLHLVESDIRTLFQIPATRIDYVIHGATAAHMSVAQNDPRQMFDTIVTGTQHLLNAISSFKIKKFLLTSSGAVYGSQPKDISHISENFTATPDSMNPENVYAEGKRSAETLCSIAAKSSGFDFVSARCFAFVGPHLPLDKHFAAGNFIRDALAGNKIEIGGDGTTLRSYLYTTDLCIWLLTLLLEGRSFQAYNVGSDQAIPISELALLVARLEKNRSGKNIPISINGVPAPTQKPERYVPSISLAQNELGLKVYTSLEKAFEKTINWYAKFQEQQK